MASLREIVEFAKQTDSPMDYLNDVENGYYWLKGQKKKHIDDLITLDEIEQIVELDRSRKSACGMTNSWEQGSWQQHDSKFTQLCSLLHQMNIRESKSTQVLVEN
jgi:hypothetical protein